MRKFYKFTKTSVEDRRRELLDFVEKYNKKYRSYENVVTWLKGLAGHYIMDSDGFEFADEETSEEPWNWGHGGIVDYSPKHHIVVNTDIPLGHL